MPNRVALLRGEIEAAHPDAKIRHRGEAGFSMSDGRFEYHRYTTGPWHWRERDSDDWAEIDTDLESRPNVKWSRGVKSARFDTLIAEDGSRRFIPRRWLPDEFVEFGPLQWKAAVNWTTPTLGAGELRGENGARGQGNRLGFDRPTHAFEVGFSGRGCRTNLVLKNASVARPLRWKVDLHGLDWKDGVLVSQSDSEQVGFIRPPSWTDASENPEPKPVPWEYANGHVTLTPDYRDAVFPVVVDPDYAIAAGADDGRVIVALSSIGITATAASCGKYETVPYYNAWFRFDGIAAAKGQDCTGATLALVCSASKTNDMLTDIYGVDEDDHAAPTTYAEWATDHGIHTAASVAWDFTTNWVAGTTYTSPDLSAIFDEIFARDNWVTSNAAGIHWDDGGCANYKYQHAAAYEDTTYAEPVLSLTLAAGGTTHTCAGAAVSASSTSNAKLDLTHDLAGAATSGSTGTAALKLSRSIVGAAGSATVTAAGLDVAHALTGAAVSMSALAATLKVGHQLAGAATSASVTAADLTAEQIHTLTGAAVTAARATAALKLSRSLTGTAASASTITATLIAGASLEVAITGNDDEGVALPGIETYLPAGTNTTNPTVGHNDAAGDVNASWTFRNVQVPKGAIVHSARLHATAGPGSSGSILSAIWCVDADDNDAPQDYASWLADHQAHDTETKTDWDLTAGADPMISPNFAAHVQHVFARDGWASGNDLTVHADNDGTTGDAIQSFGALWAGGGTTLHLIYTAVPVSHELVGAVSDATAASASLKLAHVLTGAAASATVTAAELTAEQAHTLTGGAVSATTTTAALKLSRRITGAALSATVTAGTLTVEQTHLLAGAAASTTTTAAALKLTHELAGAAVAASTATAGLSAEQAHLLTGAAVSATATAGTLDLTHRITGAAASTTVTAASLTAEQTIGMTGAAVSGTATTAALKVVHELAGAAASASATAAVLDDYKRLTGAATSASTSAAALKVAHEITGVAVSASTTAAALTAEQTILLAGTATAATATAASLGLARRMAGAATSATTTTAALKLTHELAGAATSATVTAAGLTAEQAILLVGAAESASTVTASLDLTHKLTGAATDTTATTGSLKLTQELVGAAVSATVTAAGLAAEQAHSLTGIAVSASTVAAALNVGHALTGAATSASTVAGTLKITHELAGAAVSAATVAAGLSVEGIRTLAGAAVSATTAAGSLDLTHWLTGAAADATSVSALLSLIGAGPYTATLTTSLLNNVTLAESLTASVSNTQLEAGQATLVLTPAH